MLSAHVPIHQPSAHSLGQLRQSTFMLRSVLKCGRYWHSSPSPPPGMPEDRCDILHMESISIASLQKAFLPLLLLLAQRPGLSGYPHSPPGLARTNLAVVFPLVCAEAVEKQINWIFHVQPVKLDRWSLTISSEGGKLLKTLHMRFPPPCHLEKQNEDVLRARRSPLHCPSHQKPWLKFLGNGE